MYRMCAGRLPFEGKTIMAVLSALASNTPRSLQEVEPAVRPALDELVMGLLAKEPSARPASALSVVATIRAIERELLVERQRAEPLGRVASAREPSGFRTARDRDRDGDGNGSCDPTCGTSNIALAQSWRCWLQWSESSSSPRHGHACIATATRQATLAPAPKSPERAAVAATNEKAALARQLAVHASSVPEFAGSAEAANDSAAALPRAVTERGSRHSSNCPPPRRERTTDRRGTNQRPR